MNLKALSIFLFLAYCFLVPAKAQNGFDIVYDFCTDARISSSINSTLADTDRYFVAGVTQTEDTSNLHGFLASFNYSGQLIWRKKLLFPGKNNGFGHSDQLIKIGSDRYLLTGVEEDFQANSKWAVFQPYLYLFNSSGDSVSFKHYRDSFRNRTICSSLFDGTNIVVIGQSTSKTAHPVRNSYNFDSTFVWLAKFDTLGNMIWEKNIWKATGDAYQYPDKIVLSPDKQHYVISGELRNPLTGKRGSTYGKIDTSGTTTVWAKTLNKLHYSWGELTVLANPTGAGYYWVGSISYAPDWGESSVYYGKTNEDGDLLWTASFVDSMHYARGYNILPSENPKYLLILASANVDKHIGLIKIDTAGPVTWYRMPRRIYHWLPEQNGRTLSVTPDGRYLIGGSIYADPAIPNVFDTAGTLSWMILTDNNGCRYPNDPACWPVSVKGIEKDGFHIYPNPTYDVVNIDVPGKIGLSVSVTDITGKQFFNRQLQPGKNSIDLRDMAAGIYLLNIRGSNGVTVYKISKL